MKKKFLKRFFAFALSVLLLSVSAGNAFISVNDISVSQAVVPAVIGYDVMYEMCRYIGSVYLGYTSTREMPEVNIHNDDVARIGYHVNKTLWDYGFYDNFIYPDGSPFRHSAVMATVDFYGQQYVWGSEAFQQIAETEFTVIQGGKNDGDGDDDDDDDNDENNIIHFPKKVGETAKLWFAMTATAAAGLADFITNDYQNWVNGEPDTILGDWLNSFDDTFSDYESIRNADGTYSISGIMSFEASPTGWDRDMTTYTYIFSDSNVYNPFIALDNGRYYFYQWNPNTTDAAAISKINVFYDQYILGRPDLNQHSSRNSLSSDLSTFSFNIPIFSSLEAAVAAFEANDFSDALNYAKVYRIADWLADDEYWNAQHLIDPLTGLNALSNWYNIVRHQGLNALGNELSADDFAEYLRDYFANLGTDIFPEVDPAQAPIKYPSTVEDTVIDPASNPSVYPASGSNPGTDPGTNPGTNPGGYPGTNPGTENDPDEDKKPVPGVVDIPIEDIVPTVSDSFLDIGGSLRYKFPFSIPWDIQYMLSCLAETPKAPRFELPIVVERYGINEKIIIDMKMFQTLSELSRSFFSMLFAIFLVNLTFKVVGMRKEE